VPQSTLLSIYNSLVEPHFDYYSLVWGNSDKTSSNKLQKLQNRAAQVITSLSYDADVDSLFHKLSWKDKFSTSNSESFNGCPCHLLHSHILALFYAPIKSQSGKLTVNVIFKAVCFFFLYEPKTFRFCLKSLYYKFIDCSLLRMGCFFSIPIVTASEHQGRM